MTFNPAIAEAMRLTRAGDLGRATALIQSSLGGKVAAAPPPPEVAGLLLDLTPDRRRVTEPNEKPGPSGTFHARTFRGAAGALGYRLYVPADAKAGMPLVVMLHGCTQSPEDFARGTGMNRLADELGLLVAYPGQSQSANAQKCWNWFKPGDQQRDRGEPALIAGITRQVIVDERADPSRVYVAGLSAGGAAAAIMGAAYPDLYAAVGIHSGLACGSARDLPSALKAMRMGRGGGSAPGRGRFVPVITFHGDRDTVVHEVNSREIVAAAAAATDGSLQTRMEKGRTDGGRSYSREVSADGSGRTVIEQWTIHGGDHAWAGGDASGSYTDPSGPDASREMIRFFLSHKVDA